MKVLIDGRVLRHKNITGVERYTIGLCRAFAKLGMKYDIAYPPSVNRYVQHIWEHIWLPQVARSYDILFCPANIAPIWRYKRTKLVITIHGLAYLLHPASYTGAFRLYYQYFIPAVLRSSDAVIVVSNSEKQIVLERYPWAENKLTVIQNGVDEIFLKQNIVWDKKNYILYVGSLNPLKNFSRLVEAFLRISAKVPHRLVIAGSKPAIFRKSIVKNSEKIEFVIPKDDKDLANLYLNAALLAFPSLYEASPFPPVEAMACGCPVLASNIPANRERCLDAVVYCDPNDIDDISQKMFSILSDNILKNTLIKKGLELVKNYSWEIVARKTIEVLNSV